MKPPEAPEENVIFLNREDLEKLHHLAKELGQLAARGGEWKPGPGDLMFLQTFAMHLDVTIQQLCFAIVLRCDAAIKKITQGDNERCEFSPVAPYKPSGSSFCLCNQTEWKVKVEFVLATVPHPYPCTGIAPNSSAFELGPHASRRVTLNRPPANTKPCGCNVVISREINGVWHQCSGGGGGPDLLIDPP